LPGKKKSRKKKKSLEQRRARARLLLLGLGLLLFVTIIMACYFGSIGPIGPGNPESMPPNAVVDILFGRGDLWPTFYSNVILKVRLPRIVLAATVGAALAISGTVMQGVFKNPMADPYILGLSSGGALGASISAMIPGVTGLVIVMADGTTRIPLHNIVLPLFAFLGAVGTVFLVYNIARVGGRVETGTLLLSGIAVSALFSAIVMFILFISGNQFRSLFFWMLGGFNMATWTQVYVAVPAIAATAIFTVFLSRDLNLMLMGDETARFLGMDVDKIKSMLLLMASVQAGIAVAFSGIIGFVGLIVPHMMRLVVGPDHRVLLPASIFVGATFMVWTDTAARSLIAPTEIPVGIITAICGAPFFLYLLRSRRRVRRWGSA
jgi:iron complex transport system permease protein